MMSDEFKGKIKLFLLVALVAVVLSVAGILLLRGSSPTPVEQSMVSDEKIEKVVLFEDSTGARKSLQVIFSLPDGRLLYLVDEVSYQRLPILQVGFATTGESPFVSPGQGQKYIVVELVGPGDTQSVVVLNEEGNTVTSTMDSNVYPDLRGYFVSFDSWVDSAYFRAKANSYAEGPPALEIVMDASTGNIVEKHAIDSDILGWQTYRNEEFGFEIALPGSWEGYSVIT